MNEKGEFVFGKSLKKSTMVYKTNDDENAFDYVNSDGDILTNTCIVRLQSPRLSRFTSTKSAFWVKKSQNGGLCWFLRISGLLFCALGFFVFGQGFIQAAFDAQEFDHTEGRC